MTEACEPHELSVLERQIDGWLEDLREAHDHIVAIDRATADMTNHGARWFVRMRGDDKDFTTVWLTLGQRTFRYETYVMPAPEENARELYEHLLRRNDRLTGVHFSIGLEDAVYLRGEIPSAQVSLTEVDRVLGTMYALVEQCFRSLLAIGFASRFAD